MSLSGCLVVVWEMKCVGCVIVGCVWLWLMWMCSVLVLCGGLVLYDFVLLCVDVCVVG